MLFFEIASFRYVPLAVVVFSYHYAGDGKILLRGVFGLSQSDASSSGCVRRGVFRIFFFFLPLDFSVFLSFFFFLKRQCDGICARVTAPPPFPLPDPPLPYLSCSRRKACFHLRKKKGGGKANQRVGGE